MVWRCLVVWSQTTESGRMCSSLVGRLGSPLDAAVVAVGQIKELEMRTRWIMAVARP